MRIKILRLIIVGLFAAVVLNLFYIQVIRGQYFYNLSKNNRIRVVPLEGWRGSIKDREGVVLADNRPTYNVLVTPEDIGNSEELFSFLSRVLGVDSKIISQRFLQKKVAPFAPVVIAQDIDRQKAIVLQENQYRFPSLLVEEGFIREYPLKNNSAHVLGYVAEISRAKMEQFKEYGYSPLGLVGYSGVEEYYDEALRGDPGGIQVEVNNRGQQVRLLGIRNPSQGKDITLTIDERIQKISMDLLEGKKGTIIVMDMANGEILGLTSSPAFDPNVFMNRKERKNLAALLKDSSYPLLNRATKGLFPPGSVFKLPVAICALDLKKINPRTTFQCPGFYQMGDRKFECSHVHGSQNLIDAIVHSCNVYFYNVGRLLGEESIASYARHFGLGELTHIDLPYEEKGFVPSRDQRFSKGGSWYPGDTLNFSIGQGDLLVTPLQLLMMMSTIAKDGLELKPHVILAIAGQPIDPFKVEQKVNLDPDIFKIIKQALRSTVSDETGTAHALEINGLYVAGKTGTAQTVKNKSSHAWFVGYTQGTPKDIAFCIFLEYGGSSQNACLLGRDLLMKMREEHLL